MKISILSIYLESCRDAIQRVQAVAGIPRCGVQAR